ncbi:hypothetical protein CUMW_142880 [Citrus unshiu]|nr:hypothetical protein CUMW_142880 [Citrus unshiu]
MKKQLLLPEALTRLKTILSQKQFLKIFALSAIFCFSVVCDNTSLRYAIGAATSFFNAISTFLLTCKKEFAEVYCALMPVVLVIVLASNNEPLFYLLGFLVCIGSTTRRASKSAIQQIMLTSKAEKINFMNLLVYMAPMAASIFLLFTLYIEGIFIVNLLLGNATIAYLVNLAKFLVLGNVKAALAAVVLVLIFRNPVTVMGMTEFTVTTMIAVLYSKVKKRFKISTH